MDLGVDGSSTQRIRVALDARSMQEVPPNGVGRVTGQVLPHLADRVEFELLTQTERPPLNMGLAEHAMSTPRVGRGTSWLQWSAARWLRGFDGIFHCPWYMLPLVQPVPMVVSLHDLSFERNPEWIGRSRARAFVVQARWAARTARAVITDSRHVADDVMQTYGVPADRIFVAQPAVDPVFRPGYDASALLERLGVSSPYVVAVGGSPRRNLPAAIDAWRVVRKESGLDLIVLGGEQLPPEDGLVVARLDDPDWAAVLANARALLYPTFYEGWGLPAIEAAASGTPVICARVGSLPEVLGDAAAWCESPDAASVVEQLRRLLASPEWAADLSEAGLRQAAGLQSPMAAADVYYAAYVLAVT
jgi:glycosyltransferase involved in cell wall biosynthesis